MSICKRCGKAFNSLFGAEHCWKCQKELALERTQDAIRTGDETSIDYDTASDDYVICPYCGDATCFQWGCYEDCPEHYEEGSHDIVCENCGKIFELNVCLTYSCETFKKE